MVILYDDSDGWYDHQMGPIVNQSTGPADALTGPDACGTAANSLPGIDAGNPHALGRCGYGPRLPLLVISPWARQNFVDHTTTDQTSIIHFIEDNWLERAAHWPGSFDGIASSISQMFDFGHKRSDVADCSSIRIPANRSIRGLGIAGIAHGNSRADAILNQLEQKRACETCSSHASFLFC